MREIDSLDIKALLRELYFLENSRVSKIYNYDGNFVFHLHKFKFGEKMLLIGKGIFCITEYKRKYPKVPSNFCMFLRKHLTGKFLRKIRQIGNDRILELIFDQHKLIFEIFGNYNVILTDKEKKIISALKSGNFKGRNIWKGEFYVEPERADIEIFGLNDLLKLRNLKIECVKVMANLGLGGKYAEEIIFRANVDKNKKFSELSNKEISAIFKALREVFEEVKSGKISGKLAEIGPDENIVTPIKFHIFKNSEVKEFESFNKALDFAYMAKEKKIFAKKFSESFEKELNSLIRIKGMQTEKLRNLEIKSEFYRSAAEEIYNNYSKVDRAIEIARRVESLGNNGLKKFEMEKENNPELEYITKIDVENKSITLNLKIKIEIDYSISVEKNAEYYYQQAKFSKDEIERVKRAIMETEKKISEIEKGKPKMEYEDSFKKKRKKEWYEKFRWFFSSDNFLVLAGRDATSNEVLVKKYMEDKDIYAHAEIPGAASVIIKSHGAEVPETTIEEACIFAASFSKAWSQKLYSIDVFYVNGEQVTKSPRAGEYVAKGAFIITGKRNYVKNVKLELFVWVDERGRILIAPESAAKKKSSNLIKVTPGNFGKAECAKKIREHFSEFGIEADINEIISALPGDCQIFWIENEDKKN